MSKVFSALAVSVDGYITGRVGAVVAGRNTYDDSEEFGGTGPHPTAGAVRTPRLLMIVLNATIVNVFPPSIREHLGYSRTRVAVGCAGSMP